MGCRGIPDAGEMEVPEGIEPLSLEVKPSGAAAESVEKRRLARGVAGLKLFLELFGLW